MEPWMKEALAEFGAHVEPWSWEKSSIGQQDGGFMRFP